MGNMICLHQQRQQQQVANNNNTASNNHSTSSPRAQGITRGGFSIFDITTMLLQGIEPIPVLMPLNLDELVDWTNEASKMINEYRSLYNNNNFVYPLIIPPVAADDNIPVARLDDNKADNDNGSKLCFQFQVFIRRDVTTNNNKCDDDDVDEEHHENNQPPQQPHQPPSASRSNSLSSSASVNQRNVTDFPHQNIFDRIEFYEQNVVIAIIEYSKKRKSGNDKVDNNDTYVNEERPLCSFVVDILSVSEFSAYMVLLRRLHELKTLLIQNHPTNKDPDTTTPLCSNSNNSHEGSSTHDTNDNNMVVIQQQQQQQQQPSPLEQNQNDNELCCIICMSGAKHEIVLPCSHGFCKDCFVKWVEKKLDCPFCRQRFHNSRGLKREQWKLMEDSFWSDSIQSEDLLRNDISLLESKIESFWITKRRRNAAAKDLQQQCATSTAATTQSTTNQHQLLFDDYIQVEMSIKDLDVINDEQDGFVMLSQNN